MLCCMVCMSGVSKLHYIKIKSNEPRGECRDVVKKSVLDTTTTN